MSISFTCGVISLLRQNSKMQQETFTQAAAETQRSLQLKFQLQIIFCQKLKVNQYQNSSKNMQLHEIPFTAFQ